MAKLNPSLIYSMTKELGELHEIGKQMIELIGGCKIVSWRYPDRNIKDVEVDVEDELFDTSEKYILLLELIIDRLYLIVNMSVEMINLMPEISKNKSIFKLPKNVSQPLGLSFGTLVTMFWKRLTVLSESKAQFSSNLNMSLLTTNPVVHLDTANVSRTCASCEMVMRVVKSLIHKIEECTNNLKLESVTVERRPKIEKNIIKLTQSDTIKEWTDCIISDIKKLTVYAKNKTLEYFFLLQDYEKLEHENILNVRKLKINENKYLEIEKLNKDFCCELGIVSKAQENLFFNYNKLMLELSKSKDKCKMQGENICELKNLLQEIVMENKTLTENLSLELEHQIKSMHAEKALWTELYTKNKIEIEQLVKNCKLQQENQNSIEIQIEDQLTIVNKRFSDENLKLEEDNNKLRKEVERLKKKIKAQESEHKIKVELLEDQNLKLQREIKTCKNNELILIRCPDLNGPISVPKGKQNPLEDMEEQLIANEVRIVLLQGQNLKLQRIVNKLKTLNEKSEDKQINK